jgi:hypothetical protein
MKLPMPLQCGCGEKFTLEIICSVPPEYAQCPKCHSSGYVFKPLGNLVTKLLMERVKQELENGDTTVAILLSAIAVEGEMAYLFFKWKGIDSGKYLGNRTQDDLDEWETDWANMRSVGKRLDELSRLLTDTGFDKFALQNNALLEPALDGFDLASSIKKFFQEQFFDTRNRVAHYGEIDFGKPDGDRCSSMALAMIRLLSAMDRERIKKMEEAHKKARETIQT